MIFYAAFILFDAALLARQSPAAEPQLLVAHEMLAARCVADLDKHDLVFRINRELEQVLPFVSIDLNTIAKRLHKNPHTLKSDLAKVGTSFKALVSSHQQKLACRLLRENQLSAEQISDVTGFSELSAFSRAFKRWTGKTPTDYRQHYIGGKIGT